MGAADQGHHLRAHFDVLLGIVLVLLLAVAVGRLDLVDEVGGPEGPNY